MSGFHERKAQRKEHFDRFVFGWRLRQCNSCAGSGRYDSHGSPACSGCDGTGKVRHKPPAKDTTP